MNHLQEKGFFVYAIEQCEGSTLLHDLDVGAVVGDTSVGGFAVIMGNEVKGVKQEVIDMCDGCLEIPQYGTKHSLNVSVTAGIVMWEFARKLIIE